MTKPQMKDIEKVEMEPQAVKDDRHSNRLYPIELDQAIVNEDPLIYSRAKLIQILLNEFPEDIEVIEAYIHKELEPLFNFI